MNVKKLIGKVHLWLGLSSGLLVFIVAITGSIFTFEEALFAIFHSKPVHAQVPADNAETFLSPLCKRLTAFISGGAGRRKQVVNGVDP